jgi:hypothetical protein
MDIRKWYDNIPEAMFNGFRIWQETDTNRSPIAVKTKEARYDTENERDYGSPAA